MTDIGSLAYFEWSSPAGARLDDVGALRDANPAWGTRLNEKYVLGVERSSMDDSEFARERLGIFPDGDDASQWMVVSEAEWLAVRSKESARRAEKPGWLTGAVTLALELEPDRSFATVGVAGDCREGGIGIDVAAHGAGTAWVVDRLVELTTDPERPVKTTVIDPGGPAGSLIPELVAAGVVVTECKYADMKTMTASLFDAVIDGEVVHRSRPELDAAVAGATKRTAGDTWLIDRRTSVVVGPFNAVGLAMWGHAQVLQNVADSCW